MSKVGMRVVLSIVAMFVIMVFDIGNDAHAEATPAATGTPRHAVPRRADPRHGSGTSFAVTFPAARSNVPLNGRIILLLSRDLTREPRSHVEPNEPLASPYIFGLNVETMTAGHPVVMDDRAFGWPAARPCHLA